MKTICTLLLLAFCLSLPIKAQDYTVVKNIIYTAKQEQYARERLRLDIATPKGKTGCPVVVWFHGGGLTAGEKELPQKFLNGRFVVVGVNYRLLPKVGIAQCIDDAAEAVAWIWKNISAYGGDRARLYISGHSAGGYLTMMVGFDKHWLANYGMDANAIKALLPISGQAISHFAYRNMKGIGPLQPLVDEYAPLFWVRDDCSPVVLITGDRRLELFGRYEENAYLWRMLKLAGHKDIALYELDSFDHGAVGDPGQTVVCNTILRMEAVNK